MTVWWRNAAIYQVYVRSFAHGVAHGVGDGVGVGVGDLIGIRDRLPSECTLVFSRGDLLCAVNLTDTPVDFGVEGALLPASDVPGAGDSATWLKVK